SSCVYTLTAAVCHDFIHIRHKSIRRPGNIVYAACSQAEQNRYTYNYPCQMRNIQKEYPHITEDSGNHNQKCPGKRFSESVFCDNSDKHRGGNKLQNAVHTIQLRYKSRRLSKRKHNKISKCRREQTLCSESEQIHT